MVKLRIDKWVLILSILFAIFVSIGFSYSISSMNVPISGIVKQNATLFILVLLIILFVSYFCFRVLFNHFDTSSNQANNKFVHERLRFDRIVSPKTWLLFATVLSLCWLPYLVILHPAVTRSYDYFWQLTQGLGVFPLSNHHPVFGSFVFGSLYSVGNSLGGPQMGFFVTSLCQFLLMVGVVSFCFSCLHGMGAKSYALVLGYAIICLCPVFPSHTLWLIKDSFFSSFCVLLLFQSFFRIWLKQIRVRIPWYVSIPAITIVAIVFSLLRNGSVVVSMVLFLTLFLSELVLTIQSRESIAKPFKQWGGCIAIFLLVMVSWSTMLSNANVYPSNSREALTLPLRQITRTIELHPDSLKAGDREVLEEIYRDRIEQGETLESISEKSVLPNGDQIKASYINDNTSILRLIDVWVRMGMEHPGCYLDAFLRGTDGYWWPVTSSRIADLAIETGSLEGDFANEPFRNKQLKDLFEPTVRSLGNRGINLELTISEYADNYPILQGILYSKSTFPQARESFVGVLDAFEKTPVISVVLSPGLYFWITVTTLFYAFRSRRDIAVTWPVILIWALAFLSPINGYTRYVFSAELFSIILIVACVTATSNEVKRSLRPPLHKQYTRR